MARLDQMMGNLFGRGEPTSEIKQMPWHELCYWNSWHLAMSKKERENISDA